MTGPRRLTVRLDVDASEEEVWRRLRLADDLTLEELHHVCRTALDWPDAPRYELRVLGQPYRGDDTGELGGPGSRHPARFSLSRFGFRKGDTLEYRSGPDGSRRLRLTVEAVDRPDGAALHSSPRARCLDGAGGWPREVAEGGDGFSAGDVNAALASFPWAGWESRDRSGRERPGPSPADRGRSPPNGRAGAGSAIDGLTELELAPEAEEALRAVLGRLDARTRASDTLPVPVRTAAEELLVLQARAHPGRLARARKPETWAAGAVHAAHLELGGRRAPPGARLRDLAPRFGVSPGSISRRSRELRETASERGFWSGSAGARLLARLGTELGRTAVASAPGGEAQAPPPAEAPTDSGRAVERLLLTAELGGLQAPYRKAAALLEEHAGKLEAGSLEYLLRRALELAGGEAKRRLLAVAVRHFGTDVGTWAPEGARRWL